MTSQSTADVPPAVVLLPGMDGTALLAEQFRAALDPTTCLVVRFVSRFSWLFMLFTRYFV